MAKFSDTAHEDKNEISKCKSGINDDYDDNIMMNFTYSLSKLNVVFYIELVSKQNPGTGQFKR